MTQPQEDAQDAPTRRAGGRPLPLLAGVLVAASLAGAELTRRGWSPASTAMAALALTLGTGLVVPLVSPVGTRRRVLLVLLVGGLALLRASLEEPRLGPRSVKRAALAAARDVPVVGRWRSTQREAGVVEPSGGPFTETGPAAGHRLRFELATPPPPDGTWVAILPGGDVVPPPRGPEPGPTARHGRFLATSHVHPDELVVAPGARAPFAGGAGGAGGASWMRDLRTRLDERAGELESPGPAHGVVRALLLGDRSAVAADTLDLFTRTGTRHLLALSGLHVGLVAFALLIPLTALLGAWLPLSRRAHVITLVRLALLFVYVVLVGAGDPVTRAGAAVAIGLLGPHVRRAGSASWERGRRPDSLSVWSLALVLELLADPRGLERMSLRLSYLATLGILIGTQPLGTRLRALGRSDEDAALGAIAGLPLAAPRLLLRVLTTRAARGLTTAVAASTAAVLATLPEVWARFGEVCPLGVLATPLVLPQVTLLLLLTWSTVLLPAPVLDGLVPHAAEGLAATLRLVDLLPDTPTPLPARPTAVVAAAVVLLFVALHRGGTWWRAAALAGGLVLLPWSAAPRGLELHVLDVGHGTSAVLRAPGLPALVFDVGSRDRRRLFAEALGPLLARWEVRRPWVALSHEHSDHRSGLPRLLERYPARRRLGAGGTTPRRAAGGTIHLDLDLGGVRLTTPGPVALRLLRGSEESGNEGSRTLVVHWRDEVLVLCGDAEAEGLARLLDAWRPGDPARLLLAPHHGADAALTGRLLDALDPAEVWISASRRPAIAAELDRRRLPWRWTREGSLELRLP